MYSTIGLGRSSFVSLQAIINMGRNGPLLQIVASFINRGSNDGDLHLSGFDYKCLSKNG